MSDSSGTLWSNNPYAPKIPYEAYLEQKANLAGVLIGAMFYGSPIYVSASVRAYLDLLSQGLSSFYSSGVWGRWLTPSIAREEA